MKVQKQLEKAEQLWQNVPSNAMQVSSKELKELKELEEFKKIYCILYYQLLRRNGLSRQNAFSYVTNDFGNRGYFMTHSNVLQENYKISIEQGPVFNKENTQWLELMVSKKLLQRSNDSVDKVQIVFNPTAIEKVLKSKQEQKTLSSFLAEIFNKNEKYLKTPTQTGNNVQRVETIKPNTDQLPSISKAFTQKGEKRFLQKKAKNKTQVMSVNPTNQNYNIRAVRVPRFRFFKCLKKTENQIVGTEENLDQYLVKTIKKHYDSKFRDIKKEQQLESQISKSQKDRVTSFSNTMNII